MASGQLDNTALNAVRLLCSDGTEAQSAEGQNGLWTDILKCQGNGDYIVGVRVKSEKWQGVGMYTSGSFFVHFFGGPMRLEPPVI